MGVARIRQKLGMGTPILGAPVLAHGGQVRGTSQGELANLWVSGLFPMGCWTRCKDGELSQQIDHLPSISMKPLSHL